MPAVMASEYPSLPSRQLHLCPAASALREASWSAVAEMQGRSPRIGDTAFERLPASVHVFSLRNPQSGVALRLPHALHDAPRHSQAVLEGRARRRPGVFGGGRVDDTLGILRRTARLPGGFVPRKTPSNPSGGLAKMIRGFAASNTPNTPDLHSVRRVLEGRETLAGGAATGSCGTPVISSRRAPAGAREACGDSTSPSSACFSRPARALPSSTRGNRVDPVVAPPAHLFRASGTTGTRDPMTNACDHSRDVTNMTAANAALYGAATTRRPAGFVVFGDESSPLHNSTPTTQPR